MAKKRTNAHKKRKYDDYRNFGTREKNKAKKLKKHIKKHPDDSLAKAALNKL
jgi:hypothetical protein